MGLSVCDCCPSINSISLSSVNETTQEVLFLECGCHQDISITTNLPISRNTRETGGECRVLQIHFHRSKASNPHLGLSRNSTREGECKVLPRHFYHSNASNLSRNTRCDRWVVYGVTKTFPSQQSLQSTFLVKVLVGV